VDESAPWSPPPLNRAGHSLMTANSFRRREIQAALQVSSSCLLSLVMAKVGTHLGSHVSILVQFGSLSGMQIDAKISLTK
jgi:hypothetical protein